MLRRADSTAIDVKPMAKGRIQCYDAAQNIHSYASTTRSGLNAAP